MSNCWKSHAAAHSIQKQKIHQEQQEKQRQLQAKATLNGDHPRFMIGDESSDASSTVRKEVPMMDDDIQLSDISQELVPEDRLEQGTYRLIVAGY